MLTNTLNEKTQQPYNDRVKSVLYNRILIFLGFLGIFDSGVLTIAAFFGGNVPCGPLHGCEVVAQDPTSHLLLGVPNAFIGLLGYALLTLIACAREYVGFDDPNLTKAAIAFSGIGFLVSIGLQYLAFFRIKAFCPWCFTSAVDMTLTLVFTLMLAKIVMKKPIEVEGQPRQSEPSPKVKPSYIVPILAVVTFGGLGYEAISMQGQGAIVVDTPQQLITQMEDPSGHVINPGGKVTVVEFGDLVCPFCHELYPQVENIVNQSHGQIRFIFHNFPLYTNPEHKDALPAAFLSEILNEKGQFFNFVNAVYTTPPDKKTKMVTLDQIFNICSSLGYDPTKLQARLVAMAQNPNNTDPAFLAVKKDLALAAKLGVDATPTYYVFAPGQPEEMAQNDSILKILAEPAIHKYWGSPAKQ